MSFDEEVPNTKNKSGQYKYWTFTIFNYTDEKEYILQKYVVDTPQSFVWVRYGHEICPHTQRPHLQGVLACVRSQSLSYVAKKLWKSHVEGVRGTLQDNLDYTGKDATDIVEVGERPISLEQHNKKQKIDWAEQLKQARETGEVSDPHTQLTMARTIEHLHNKWKSANLTIYCPIVELRPWQQELVTLLQTPSDDRKINWVYDHAGNKGKSALASYLVKYHGATRIQNSTYDNMSMILPDKPKIVVFDFARVIEMRCPYEYMEMLKGGWIQSNKYQVVTKSFHPPHILVLANFAPDFAKWTDDRVNLITL